MAETEAAGAGLDEQETQFGSGWLLRMLDKKNVADALAIDVGDPASFAAGIEVGDEIGDNTRNESFKGSVPTVLFGICGAFPANNPAHVANTMRTEDEWWAASAGWRD